MSDKFDHQSRSTASSVVSILNLPMETGKGKVDGEAKQEEEEEDDVSTIGSFVDGDGDEERQLSKKMVDRVRRFIARLASRTMDMKKIRPDSPSSLDSYATKSTSNAANEDDKQEKNGHSNDHLDEDSHDVKPCQNFRVFMLNSFNKFVGSLKNIRKGPQAIDPNSKVYLTWLFVVSVAFLYNCMATVLRGTFTASPIYACPATNAVPFCPSDPVPLSFTTASPYETTTIPNVNSTLPFADNSTLKSSSSDSSSPADDEVPFTIYSAAYLSAYSLEFCRALFCKPTNESVPTHNGSTTSNSHSTPSTRGYSTGADAWNTALEPFFTIGPISNITSNWSSAGLDPMSNGSYSPDNGSTTVGLLQETSTYSNETTDFYTSIKDVDDGGSFEAVGTKDKDCVIIGCFPGYETELNRHLWWTFDYICDAIYAVDMLLIKTRVIFIRNGLLETMIKETAKQYVTSTNFKLDVISVLPTDLFYLIPAFNLNALVRLNRLLKIQTFWEFYERLDQTVSSGYIVRVAKTMTYMLYLIHVEACAYFVVCKYIGIGTDGWVWRGKTLPYIHCMYLATKTAACIGNNWNPTIQEEYIFMTAYWLIGLFIFAILIGQIRDIFHSTGANRERYRKAIDQTMFYLKSLGVSPELQGRVLMWFNFNWMNSKTLDENALLDPLPRKMRTDLAIHVHLSTLSKVKLFQDCEKSLLYDLVLKLKPVLFLPGDYICKKGEVGIEMYIVKMGIIEVVGGPGNSIVFATLKEGSVFGEISLLALAGGNRRTADVRSKGYSQLFLLSKADFEEAMSDYPEAYKMLKHKSKKLLSQNKKPVEKPPEENIQEAVQPENSEPKLYQTVLQVVEKNEELQNKWPVLSFQAWTSNPNASSIRRSFQDSTSVGMNNPKPSEKQPDNGEKIQKRKTRKNKSSSNARDGEIEQTEISRMGSSLAGSIFSIEECDHGLSRDAENVSRKSYRKKSKSKIETLNGDKGETTNKSDKSRDVVITQMSQNGEIVFLNHVDVDNRKLPVRSKSSIGKHARSSTQNQNIGCVEETVPHPEAKPTSIGTTSYLAYLYSKIYLRNRFQNSSSDKNQNRNSDDN